MSGRSRTKGRYPLEPLRILRRLASEQTAVELAEQARRTETAERAAARTVELRESLERALAEALESEGRRLEQGLLKVADLQKMDEFRGAAEQRLAELKRAEAAAKEELARLSSAEGDTRAALGRAHAALSAVNEHRQRWQEQRTREQEEAQAEDHAEGRTKGPAGWSR